MSTEVIVPTLGESIAEATLGQWLKQPGEAVAADEPIASLETDKVAVEVTAPVAGVMGAHIVSEGATVNVGAVIGSIEGGAGAAAATAPAAAAAPSAAPAAHAVTAEDSGDLTLSPSVRRLVLEHGLDPTKIKGTGKDGRLTKDDVMAAVSAGTATAKAETAPAAAPTSAPAAASSGRAEERVRMTRLRQTVAKRLKEAQNTAAMLTTFNEVDMTEVMALRARYKDVFEKKHGNKLGFMGFFVKACVQALKELPAVNAEIDGTDLIYKNYYHIGIAVGTEKGLVVPVVRDADQLSISGVEKTIADFGKRARDGQLKIEEMQGGTFTITNGGIYGSLMSTPILNAPQSGILGMHKIQERPMVVNGKIEVRPMMYLALSYDHRIVDGKEAVTFLVRVKEALEDPARLVLDL